MVNGPSDCDVLVVGSGSAGMAAALAACVAGAKVIVAERGETIGGTSAVSGGLPWIPAHNRAKGVSLPVSDALDYLESLSNESIDMELAEVFVRSGAATLDLIEQNSAVKWNVIDGLPDYRPERPGGKAAGGRSLGPEPLPAGVVGEWDGRITEFPADAQGGGVDEETKARLFGGSGEGALVAGKALIAGLLRGVLDHGGEVRTGTRAVSLITEDGAVRGAKVLTDSGEKTIRASRGVVLASGGFEWDPQLVSEFLRGPMHRPVSPPLNTGDGLKMAMALGAELANMSEAWWCPVVHIPGDTFLGHQRGRSVRIERTLPRSIMVNRVGKRFVNEAVEYNAIAGGFHYFDPQAFAFVNSPAWVVFDHGFLECYPFLGVTANDEIPDWYNASPDLRTLAERTGIDADGIEATVERWNENVAAGTDPDFERGNSVYDTYWGDLSQPVGAMRTLGPLDKGPYYAVPIDVGTLGTKGGPRTDGNAQVRHIAGGLIPGLYAAGNTMASSMGRVYGGAGGTIGPAIVWGTRAGHHAATGEAFPA
jgi:3-oxosteroid 1-dehydrogenase